MLSVAIERLTERSKDRNARSPMNRSANDTSVLRSQCGPQPHWQPSMAAQVVAKHSDENSVDAPVGRRSSVVSMSIEGTSDAESILSEAYSEGHDPLPEDTSCDCIQVTSYPEDQSTAASARAINSANDESLADEWPVERIIGEEHIDGKVHYLVEWKPTLVSEDDALNMPDLIEQWERRKTLIKAKSRRGAKRDRVSVMV